MVENSMRLQAETGDFIRVFEANISQKRTLRAAYEATEKEHERLTGHRKYGGYQSFSRVRGRKMRKKGTLP